MPLKNDYHRVAERALLAADASLGGGSKRKQAFLLTTPSNLLDVPSLRTSGYLWGRMFSIPPRSSTFKQPQRVWGTPSRWPR